MEDLKVDARMIIKWDLRKYSYHCAWNCRISLRTYCMVQSPSWETNWFAASQEIPCMLWNPRVHYRTHKPPLPVPIQGQSNPVHTRTSHLLEIHPNIIHPFTPRSLQWSLSLRFPRQNRIGPPLLIHTRHMSSPSHSSRFYHHCRISYVILLQHRQPNRTSLKPFCPQFILCLLSPCISPLRSSCVIIENNMSKDTHASPQLGYDCNSHNT